MRALHIKIMVGIFATILLAVPVFGNPGGPSGKQGSDLTAEVGCSCHGGGGPSADVIVSISGMPDSYNLSTNYTFSVSVDSAGAKAAGFLMTDYGAGNFTWDTATKITYTTDVNGTISHSNPNEEKSWTVYWTSPSQDVGLVRIALVGNAVNLNGAPDEGDLWSIRYITIDSPGSISTLAADDVESNTASSGSKSVFDAAEDPEAAEKEYQLELANNFFKYGNLYYWSTLAILIAGAVVQREFYERKFGGGPPHLAMELAIPQGLKRGSISLVLMFLAIYGFGTWGTVLIAALSACSLWAGYGVYRTIVQAKATPSVDEML